MSTNSPAPHEPVNLIPVRGEVAPPAVNAAPRMPVSPPFLGDRGVVPPLARDPMAPVTPMSLGSPMTIGQTDRQTGASADLAAPASQASPAVRPFK
jgi:hypothetical protein